MTNDAPHTGGCQCGAIRYRIAGELLDPHICHCRMCQKAFGSFFAPFVGTGDGFEWTRGKPSIYKSSTYAERGFCPSCGTPLTYSATGSDKISVSIGSLDRPEGVRPGRQYGVEGRMPWFHELADLPGACTGDDMPAQTMAAIKSNQHPDHD
jgi:hypothetical protein